MRLQRESGESITAVARRLGLSPETLRNWVRRDEVERGERGGIGACALPSVASEFPISIFELLGPVVR